MSKGKKVAIVLLLLLAGLLVAYWISNLAEPSYQGRSAGAWLDDIQNPNYGDAPAFAALKAMGSNATPAIVRRLRESESPWRNKYRDFFPRFPRWLAKIMPKPKADFSYTFGASAFAAIGPSVEPQLVKLLKDESPLVRTAATMGLGNLRSSGADITDAIPGLIEALRDQSKAVRVHAVFALSYAGPEADSAVPALIPLLIDSEILTGTSQRFYIRSAAARALGKFGPRAKAALPSLTNLLADNDTYLRVVTAVAIWRIDGDVTNTLPILIEGLSQIQEPSKWEVIDGMAEMGPRAKAAVPALLGELNLPPRPAGSGDPNRGYNLQKITNALKLIDPEAAAKAGVK